MSSAQKRSHDSPMSDRPDFEDRTEPPFRRSRTKEISHISHEVDEISRATTAQYLSTDEIPRISSHVTSSTGEEDIGRLKIHQKKIISLWYENLVQREAESNIPNDRMDALATAISAPPQLVTEFIQSRRSSNDDTYQDSGSERQGRAISPSRRMSDSDSESYSVIEANNHLPPMILKPVEKYVSACRRRRSQNDGRRSVNTGPFRCTFGCGYRTKRAFDWRRHEETHEPQELWLCSLCIQRDTQNPFLVNRKDKFIKHVTDKHGGWGADKALAKSKVEFVPRAELGCSFCNVESINWDERCRHVLGHYEDEVEREMRKVKVIYEERADGRSISAGVE